MNQMKKVFCLLGVVLSLFIIVAIPNRASAATWTANTTFGTHFWSLGGITASADGMKLALIDKAGTHTNGYIYTSTDGGITWTLRTSAGFHSWESIAMSADGMKIIAADFGGYLYTSTDSGATWIARTTPGMHNWTAVASSADGMKLVAGVSGGMSYPTESNAIYTSTDGGATWVLRITSTTAPSNYHWRSIASSADGVKLIAAVQDGGYLYTSTDSGATWTARTSAGIDNWITVSSSANGTRLIAGSDENGTNRLLTSADGGVTWTPHASVTSHAVTASSADGMKLFSAGSAYLAQNIFTSVDGGSTWTAETAGGSRNWWGLAISSDATRIVGTDIGGYLYTGVTTVATLVPVVATISVSDINATSAVFHGNIVSTGSSTAFTVTDIGFDFVNEITNVTQNIGAGSPSGPFPVGSYSFMANPISCGTPYHFRATATNSIGTGYGSYISFTTLPCPTGTIVPPTVTTVSATAVTANSVMLNGLITSLGGTATSATVSSVGFDYGFGGLVGTHSVTTGSFGLGAFSTSITGLGCGVPYTFHANATNSAGTGQGVDMTFTTLPCPPTTYGSTIVVTVTADPQTTRATLTGNLIRIPGPNSSTVVGFVYGPTLAYGNIVAAGPATKTTGVYTKYIIGLIPNTLYHYKAYASNSYGTVYGEDMTFTTTDGLAPLATASYGQTNSAVTAVQMILIAKGYLRTTATGYFGGATMSAIKAFQKANGLATTGGLGKLTLALLTDIRDREGIATTAPASASVVTPASSSLARVPATVSTISSGLITKTGATLNGHLDTLGSASTATVGFSYGNTTAYGTNTTLVSEMTSPAGFSSHVNLSCGTSYHFRSFAQTTASTVYGSDMIFTTPLCN